MTRFENATPRPWRAEGPDMFGDFNIQGPVDALAIGAVVTNMRLPAEVAANAELIVTAVNAFDAFRAAAEPIIEALMHNEERLVRNYSKLGSDEEELVISQGQARALRAALKLARGGS